MAGGGLPREPISAITERDTGLPGGWQWRSRIPAEYRSSTRCMAGSTTFSMPARAAANASRRARWSSRPVSTRQTRSLSSRACSICSPAAPGTKDAERWAQVCTNSGKCIPACDYGINPRFMVNMARIAAKAKLGDDAVRRARAAIFHDDGPQHARDLAAAAAARGAGPDQPAAARRRRIRRDAGHRLLHRLQRHQDAAYRAVGAGGARRARRALRGDGRQRDLLRHPAVQARRREDGGTGLASTRSSGWPARARRASSPGARAARSRSARSRCRPSGNSFGDDAVRHEPDRRVLRRTARRSAAAVRPSGQEAGRVAGALGAARRDGGGQAGARRDPRAGGGRARRAGRSAPRRATSRCCPKFKAELREREFARRRRGRGHDLRLDLPCLPPRAGHLSAASVSSS